MLDECLTKIFIYTNSLPVILPTPKLHYLSFMKKWIILGICILTIANSVNAQIPAQTVPDFRFLQKNGTAFTRQQLPSGKPLFFAFFDITCDHCQKAMQYLNSHYLELGKAAVYLVTLDPGPSAEAFLNKYAPQLLRQPNTVLLRDTRNQFIALFQPRKYPSLFLYSPRQQLILYSDEEKDLSAFVTKIKTTK